MWRLAITVAKLLLLVAIRVATWLAVVTPACPVHHKAHVGLGPIVRVIVVLVSMDRQGTSVLGSRYTQANHSMQRTSVHKGQSITAYIKSTRVHKGHPITAQPIYKGQVHIRASQSQRSVCTKDMCMYIGASQSQRSIYTKDKCT